MTKDRLRVGVLCDGELCRWQVNALNQMVKAGAEIETVIVNEGSDSRVRHNMRNAPGYLLIAGSREASVRLLGNHSYLRSIPESDVKLLDGVQRVYCEPVPRTGLGQELPQKVVNNHCSDLDVLVRFGFGIIRGKVLKAPTYGVFSYHHGDIRKYRGRPAGFWEFINSEPTIGVTLQQLTDELDGGKVIQIREFRIRKRDTYQDIMRTIYRGSIDMLGEAVSTIQQEEFDPSRPDSFGDLYTAPNWASTIRYFIKNTKKRFGQREQ